MLAKVFGLQEKEQLAKNAVNHSDVRETLASLPLPSYVAKLGRRLFGRRSLFLSFSLCSASQWISVAFQITEMESLDMHATNEQKDDTVIITPINGHLQSIDFSSHLPLTDIH